MQPIKKNYTKKEQEKLIEKISYQDSLKDTGKYLSNRLQCV